MSSRPGAGHLLLLVLCLGLALPLAVLAGGRAEKGNRDRLAQVEQLITEKRYNEAISELSKLIKENPDLFDAAERLMARIRTVRAKYNAKLEELFQAIRENNEDKGRILIEELENLDPHPNEEIAAFLDNLKRDFGNVAGTRQFTEIMNAAADLLRQGMYAEANSRYLEGFGLERENFDAWLREHPQNILENTVQGSLESVQAAVASFPGALERLDTRGKELSGAISLGDPPRLASEVQNYVQAVRVLPGLEAAVLEAGENLKEQNAQYRGLGKPIDRFTSFGWQLVLGRKGMPREGIAAVFGLPRESSVAERKKQLLAAADALWQDGLKEFAGGQRPGPVEKLGRAGATYSAALPVLTLWSLSLPPRFLLQLDPSAAAAVAREGSDFLLAQERIRAARAYVELSGVENAFLPIERRGMPALTFVPPIRRELSTLRQRTGAMQKAWTADAELLQQQGQASGLDLRPHAEQALALGQTAEALRGRIEAFDLQLLSAYAEDSLGRLTRSYEGFRTRFANAKTLQEGAQTPQRLEKYPGKALAAYTQLNAELPETAAEVERLSVEFGSEAAYLQASAGQRQAELRSALSGLQADVAAGSASAQQAVQQAGRFKQEGDLRVKEVRKYLAASPLREAPARESLRNAQEAYDRSLEFQEDPEVRRERDETLSQLAQKIDAIVNEQVIKEVRVLIDKGRKKFSIGDYSGAESDFLDAERRWRDTHGEPNAEVALWLDWTNSAVQNVAGREITLSNPLYPQMSQLYNLAFLEYQEGRRLVEAGRIQEALALLKKTVERLDQIKVLFPYNSEAQILILRIEQLRDTDVVPGIAGHQVPGGPGQGERNPQEALNDLEVIRFLNPDSPA